jgi:hypothetical protein
MPAIDVHMLIKLDGPIVFHRWLPDRYTNAINYYKEGIELDIWFDHDSLWLAVSDPEEIYRTINVRAYKIHVNARANVSDALRDYIQTHISHHVTGLPPKEVAAEYLSIGGAIQRLIVGRINRLLGYASAMKGQVIAHALAR